MTEAYRCHTQYFVIPESKKLASHKAFGDKQTMWKRTTTQAGVDSLRQSTVGIYDTCNSYHICIGNEKSRIMILFISPDGKYLS